MKSKHAVPVAVLFLVIGGALALLFLGSQDREGKKSALLKALPKAKLSLADAIRQSAAPPAAAISAKFELDESGNLSLSVYTAEKGVAVGADDNVLKEVSGNAEKEAWNPGTEVINDPSDLAYARTQLGIMSNAKVSLLDVVEEASRQGTVISAVPQSKGGNQLFDVEVVSDGKVRDLAYDTAGTPITNKQEEGDDDDD